MIILMFIVLALIVWLIVKQIWKREEDNLLDQIKNSNAERTRSYYSNKWDTAKIGWMVPPILFTVIAIIIIGVSPTYIFSTVQKINIINKKVEIYTMKKDSLQYQYMQIFDTNYRTYESEYYTNITNAVKGGTDGDKVTGSLGVNIKILPAWPATKYLESLKELSAKIEVLNEAIYVLQISKQDLLAEARSYKSGIWVPSWLQPSIPE